jgi:cobyrinic acid a,c-diamide synthase
MAHLYIAAAHKSSGKTTFSIGLTAALVQRGLTVQPYKKGPDYIDPLWLARAAGRPCYNLDFFTQSHAEIAEMFISRMEGADIGLVEGNKGLYDGVDVDGSDSNAALSVMLAAPVILVIDTAGITRGIAPLVCGYVDFDPQVGIRGVILNRVSGARHETKLRAALENYTDMPVLGVIGRDHALEIPERHLGLVPANEATGHGSADTMISRLASVVHAGVDLDRIIAFARAAPLPERPAPPAESVENVRPADVRIAIARDAAFGFYYPDDLQAFARAGAELLPFDTLHDKHLPAADGLFIGGGFPETHLDALSSNTELIRDICAALAAGLPAYAECGGLMYLSRRIEWRGMNRDMVGAVPADTVVEERPQGRGYMLVTENSVHPWPRPDNAGAGNGKAMPVHEFHYAGLHNLAGDHAFAYQVTRGNGIDGHHDGLVINNLLAGFAHHRNTAANPWVERFVQFVRDRKDRRPG